MCALVSDTDVLISPPLLGKDEPAPFQVLNPNGKAKCIILCDHASNRIPAKLNNLGLTEEDLQNHYAIDIGVAKITEIMAEKLDAPALIGNYSRLVVDLNRRVTHPTAFVTVGEGQPIPGNITMGEQERDLRIQEIYNPFHDKLDEMIEGFMGQGIVPAVISIHSFTKVFYKQIRPWEVGVLWVQDERLPKATIDYFRAQGYTVGDNEPYNARFLRGTTVDRHADSRGLPNALVEVRNDLIDTDEKAADWANKLVDCYKAVLEDESLYAVYEGEQVAYDPHEEEVYFEKLIANAKKGDGDE